MHVIGTLLYLENTWNIFWFGTINVTLRNRPDMEELAVNSATDIYALLCTLYTHNVCNLFGN